MFWRLIKLRYFFYGVDHLHGQMLDQRHSRPIIVMKQDKWSDAISTPFLRTSLKFCQTLSSIQFLSYSGEQLTSLLRVPSNLMSANVALRAPTPEHHSDNQCYPDIRHLELSLKPRTRLNWFDVFLICTSNLARFGLNISRSYDIVSCVELRRILTTRRPSLEQRSVHSSHDPVCRKVTPEHHQNVL